MVATQAGTTGGPKLVCSLLYRMHQCKIFAVGSVVKVGHSIDIPFQESSNRVPPGQVWSHPFVHFDVVMALLTLLSNLKTCLQNNHPEGITEFHNCYRFYNQNKLIFKSKMKAIKFLKCIKHIFLFVLISFEDNNFHYCMSIQEQKFYEHQLYMCEPCPCWVHLLLKIQLHKRKLKKNSTYLKFC